MTLSPRLLSAQAYRTAAIASTWLCLAAVGCRSKARPQLTSLSSQPPAALAPSSVASATSAPALPSYLSPPSASGRNAVPLASASGEVDLGQAPPVALGGFGAVALSRSDALSVALFRDGRAQPFSNPIAEPASVPVALVEKDGLRAYWVSHGRLVRSRIQPTGQAEPLEVLAEDAADNTRVVAVQADGPSSRDVVLYIGKEVSRELERGARLWVEGHGSQRISREAGGATALAAVSLGAGRVVLVTLDGRVGMSPVHAIDVQLDDSGTPHLGEDRVVFVAGPAQWSTPLSALRVGGAVTAFVPISKESTQFGLLSLLIKDAEPEASSSWYEYPNGLNHASIAAAQICDRPFVALVRPTEAKEASDQVLELGKVQPAGQLTELKALLSGRRLGHLALAKADGDKPSGWLGYSVAGSMRVRPVACR